MNGAVKKEPYKVKKGSDELEGLAESFFSGII